MGNCFEELAQLKAMGYTDRAACISALDRSGGDVVGAVAVLSGSLPKTKEEIRFATQLAQLAAMGFTKRGELLHVLKVYDGDVQKVVEAELRRR